jgi:hypothetical protein
MSMIGPDHRFLPAELLRLLDSALRSGKKMAEKSFGFGPEAFPDEKGRKQSDERPGRDVRKMMNV